MKSRETIKKTLVEWILKDFSHNLKPLRRFILRKTVILIDGFIRGLFFFCLSSDVKKTVLSAVTDDVDSVV